MRVAAVLVLAVSLSALGCNESDAPPTTPGPNPLPGADPYAHARAGAVDVINDYRATLGLPALAHWTEADPCSDAEVERDAGLNRPHASFGDCGESAQNECLGFSNVESILGGCLAYMWNEGPGTDYSKHGHYINMTNPAYTMVSIGFYTTPEGEGVVRAEFQIGWRASRQ